MCGRYSLAGPSPAEVRSRYPIDEAVEIRRRYNVAPGDDVLAVTTDREGRHRGELLRWGFVPSWSERPESGLKMINARVETVAERPAFRAAFQRMRCLILADGFFEWQPTATGSKQAFHITARERPLFAFAGIWSVWHGAAGATVRSCSILTTAANSSVSALHDRMPVILGPAAEGAWLDPGTRADELAALLSGLPAADTCLRAVGPAVNDARYDGPDCLADPAPAQPALF